MAKPLKLHWSSSKPNFGDALSPLICEALSAREVIYATPSQCDLVAIGSLLQRLNGRRFQHSAHVWGTGFISARKKLRSTHVFHAVRGKLTRAIACPNQDVALGDPGLLADMLTPPDRITNKKYGIGFVEHYKDRGNPIIGAIAERHTHATIIDVFTPPVQFLERLAECDIIFSSAMHGLIAADSLGIPNAWMKLSDRVRGDDFKFRDYYSVFDMDPNPVDFTIDSVQQIAESVANDYRRVGIAEIKKRLMEAFPDQL